MRVVIQRVKRAHVSVGERVVGRVERGLMVLVGVSPNDTAAGAFACVCVLRVVFVEGFLPRHHHSYTVNADRGSDRALATRRRLRGDGSGGV